MPNRSRNIPNYNNPSQLIVNEDGANWAFWKMDEGSGNVLQNDSRGNITLDDVPLSGTGGTEWSNPGWLTGDSTNLKGTLTYAADNDLASVCDFNNKSAIIGFQIVAPAAVGGRDTILHIGGHSGSTRYGLWLAQENTATNDRLIYQLRDNAGTATSLTYGSSSMSMDGTTVYNGILTIDGSATQIKLDGTTSTDTITELQGGAGDYSALGDMTLSAQAGTPALNIMFDPAGALYFGGQLRRLLIANYGAYALPTNIQDVKQSLYESRMLPTWTFANSVRGAAL